MVRIGRHPPLTLRKQHRLARRCNYGFGEPMLGPPLGARYVRLARLGLLTIEEGLYGHAQVGNPRVVDDLGG